LITSKADFDADGAPASAALRGLCGATWDDLRPLEEYVFSLKDKSSILDPEQVCHSVPAVVDTIKKNYEQYLPGTWNLEANGRHFLRTGFAAKATKPYQEFYETLTQYQDKRKTRVHKGHPLHNIGISIVSTDRRLALDYFMLAHIEDVLSERKKGQAQSMAAFTMLTSGFGLGRASIEELDKYTRTRGAGEFRPEKVLESFRADATHAQAIGTVAPDPVVIERGAAGRVGSPAKVSVDDLPGSYATRVFIGGSYADEPTLHDIESYLREIGLVGIVAIDYAPPVVGQDPLLTDHDMDVLLIHLCRCAIFELSTPAAQLAEVEWAIRFFNKPTWGARTTRSQRVSTHIENLFTHEAKHDIFTYSRNEELREYIISQLSNLPKI